MPGGSGRAARPGTSHKSMRNRSYRGVRPLSAECDAAACDALACAVTLCMQRNCGLSHCRRCRCLQPAAQCLLQPARRLASTVAAAQRSDAAPAAAAQQLDIDEKLLRKATPQYCSGCGVKLQQEDTDAPG